MKNEKRESLERPIDGDRLNDQEQMYPSFHAPVPDKCREPWENKVDRGNVTDWLTATYWG